MAMASRFRLAPWLCALITNARELRAIYRIAIGWMNNSPSS